MAPRNLARGVIARAQLVGEIAIDEDFQRTLSRNLRTVEARIVQFCAPLLPGGGIQDTHATVGLQLHPGYDLAPQLELFGIAGHRI